MPLDSPSQPGQPGQSVRGADGILLGTLVRFAQGRLVVARIGGGELVLREVEVAAVDGAVRLRSPASGYLGLACQAGPEPAPRTAALPADWDVFEDDGQYLGSEPDAGRSFVSPRLSAEDELFI